MYVLHILWKHNFLIKYIQGENWKWKWVEEKKNLNLGPCGRSQTLGKGHVCHSRTIATPSKTTRSIALSLHSSTSSAPKRFRFSTLFLFSSTPFLYLHHILPFKVIYFFVCHAFSMALCCLTQTLAVQVFTVLLCYVDYL